MFVLYTRPSIVTGRSLRRQLEARGGTYRFLRRQQYSGAVVNWGSTRCPDSEQVLNPAEAVANAANKLRSLQLMKEAGVNVPRFSVSATDFEDSIFLGRHRSHRGGTDIEVFDAPHSTAVYSDYFTEFVPSVREQRIHIFRGELIGAQNKVYRGDSPEAEVPVRNHDNGYVFIPMLETRPHEVRIREAIKAVEAHNLDFGAVDVLITPEDDTVILEVNTAPGLSERYLNIYADAIQAWAEEEA